MKTVISRRILNIVFIFRSRGFNFYIWFDSVIIFGFTSNEQKN